MTKPLTIDIVSDVVCPWCYIGKRKLEAALASPEAAGLPPIEIRWHPFQLNPDMPQAGVPRKQYLEEKFGGPERAAEIYARVGAAGKAVGLSGLIVTAIFVGTRLKNQYKCETKRGFLPRFFVL